MSQILLVEPDRQLANIYGQTLTDAGHHVVAAATAQAGIQAADIVRPEIVILELQLVEHSGIEFLYEFRSYPDWQNVPVIIHTNVPPAEFSNSQRLLKDELGVRLYMYKPQTSLRQLIASVRELSTVKA